MDISPSRSICFGIGAAPIGSFRGATDRDSWSLADLVRACGLCTIFMGVAAPPHETHDLEQKRSARKHVHQEGDII